MSAFLIICVDADPINRSELEADIGRLTGDQFQVETYPDGRSALARADELKTSDRLVPLMIAADLLPDTTGVDLLMQVHRQPRFRGTRKVLLSADPAMEDVGRAIGKRSLDGILPIP